MSPPPPPPLSRERVLDVAHDLLEAEGVEGLTMRALAAKLGVAVTAIYWHVGNKETLLAELGDRVIAEVGAVHGEGATSRDRVCSLARSLYANLAAHPHLVAIVHQQGRHEVVFLHARRLLAEEFAAAGLRGRDVVVAVAAILRHVVGSILIERAVDRSPVADPSVAQLWTSEREQAGLAVDDETAAHLADDLDPGELFDRSLDALVCGLLP